MSDTTETTPAIERMVYEWQYIKPGTPTLQIMETLIRAAINIDELARAAHADDLAHGRAAVAWPDMDDDAIAWYMDNARAVRLGMLGDDQ